MSFTAPESLFRLAFCLAMILLLPGCPPWNDVVIPPDPASVGNSDPGSVSYEHDVEIEWKFPELNYLQSLTIQYPANVKVIQSQQSSELSIQIRLFIEKTHHDDYANEYLKQILAQSKLDPSNPILSVPSPSHPCQMTQDVHGNVTDLRGICPQQMIVIIPASHPVPVAVSSPESSPMNWEDSIGVTPLAPSALQ